jgi:hypothetical protein
LVIQAVPSLVITCTIGIVLLTRGTTTFGVFILVGPSLGVGINLFLRKRAIAGQQPGIPRQRAKTTGRTLAPPRTRRPLPPNRSPAWTGGGNMATEMGRMNATWPLAVLTVHEDALTIRFRPKLIARCFGVGPCVWHVGEVIVVYPVIGRLIGLTRGLAIESHTMPRVYFWTQQPEPILSMLNGQYGIPVDWTERHIKLFT